MYFVSLMKFQDFCRFSKGAPFFYRILKTYMILLFLIIILIGLNVLKLVWSKSNASMNFRGGNMLEVNNVLNLTVLWQLFDSCSHMFLTVKLTVKCSAN